MRRNLVCSHPIVLSLRAVFLHQWLRHAPIQLPNQGIPIGIKRLKPADEVHSFAIQQARLKAPMTVAFREVMGCNPFNECVEISKFTPLHLRDPEIIRIDHLVSVQAHHSTHGVSDKTKAKQPIQFALRYSAFVATVQVIRKMLRQHGVDAARPDFGSSEPNRILAWNEGQQVTRTPGEPVGVFSLR